MTGDNKLNGDAVAITVNTICNNDLFKVANLNDLQVPLALGRRLMLPYG